MFFFPPFSQSMISSGNPPRACSVTADSHANTLGGMVNLHSDYRATDMLVINRHML